MTTKSLSYSEFDSDVFGVRFFRLTSADAEGLADELEKEKSRGPMIVDAKVVAGEREQELRLVKLGFRKVTTIVELFAKASKPPSGEVGPEVVDSLTLNAADLRAHAASFVFQRFRQDPLIPPEDAIRFMETWIANSLGGRRQVLAIGRNFLTYRRLESEIELELMSCLDRNVGMATGLVSAAKSIASDLGLPMRTATEAENMPAMRVHFSHGFLPSKATLALHLVHGYRTSG